MTLKDILELVALALSPVIAVVIGQRLQNQHAVKERRLSVFRTLMATRATPIHVDRVRALNVIDVEFYHEEEICEAWRTYFEFLEKQTPWTPAWQEESNKLFATLLHAISASLGYDIPKTDILRRAYMPQGHGDYDADVSKIRKAMVAMTEGKAVIPIYVAGTAPDPVVLPPLMTGGSPQADSASLPVPQK